MARFSHSDIILEIVELSRDVMNDIQQQLSYYRASVYKDETANQIKAKVEHLRLVVDLLGSDMLREPFRDHDAQKLSQAVNYIPGECSFSARTARLMVTLEEQLGILGQQANAHVADNTTKSLALNVQKHRGKLLSLCRYGSRQWAFFQSL